MRIVQLLRDRISGKAPKDAKRSNHWSKVRAIHLLHHPSCQVCESTKLVEVHHIIPFHIAPDKELDPDNLITLCECKKYGINCHLLVGHLGNYRRANFSCRADAAYWRERLR